MFKREYILPGLLFIAITLAFNVMMTKYLVDKSIDSIEFPAVPRIVTVNLDKIVDDKLNEGMTPIQVMTFTDTLVQLLLSDGYLVLDSEAVINAPDQYVLRNVSTEQLDQMVKERGIVIKNGKNFEEALKRSEEELKQILSND